MKKLVLASLLLLSLPIWGREVPVRYNNSQVESVQVRKILEIKECLTNKAVARCLNGGDLHVVQRILSHYVIAQSRRSMDQ